MTVRLNFFAGKIFCGAANMLLDGSLFFEDI